MRLGIILNGLTCLINLAIGLSSLRHGEFGWAAVSLLIAVVSFGVAVWLMSAEANEESGGDE